MLDARQTPVYETRPDGSLFWSWPIASAPPIIAGMAMGTLVLLLVAHFYKEPGPDPLTAHILPWAKAIVSPDERDQFFYHTGIALTGVFGIGLAWLHSRVVTAGATLAGQRPGARYWLALAIPPLCLALRMATPWAWPGLGTTLTHPATVIVLLLMSVASVGVAAARRGVVAGGSIDRVIPLAPTGDGRSERSTDRWIQLLLHLVAVTAVFLLLYVPDYRSLTGTFYLKERFHHWHFFAVVPTFAYLSGLVPVLDVYSQYGIGIPVIFGNLCRLLGDFSHGTLIWLGIVYGVAYYIGLYALFWVWLRQWSWSVAGVAFALLLQQFSGFPGEVMWQCPSSTVLRYPIDVWVWLLLTRHVHNQAGRSLTLASVLVGLAMFWETDTGLYLGVGLLAYCSYWSLDDLALRGWSWSRLGRYAATLALAPLTCVALIAVSVGGAVMTPEFWSHFMEPLLLFRSGFGMLPMPAPGPENLHLFLTPALYVFTGVLALAAALQLTGRPWRDGYLLGAVGAYGIGLYHQYVGRSHPWNWFHICLPFVLIATVLTALLVRGLERRLQPRSLSGYRSLLARRGVQLLPALLMAAGIVLLATNPSVRIYPSVLSGRWATPGVAWDMPGADFRTPPTSAVDRSRFESVAVAIQSTVPEDEPVAIFSVWDGLLYVLANRRPFSRFVPLYPSVALDYELDEVLAALDNPRLRFVFFDETTGGLLWQSYLPTTLSPRIVHDFKLVDRIGGFQILRRAAPAGHR